MEPKNVHDMRVFLGMTNYERKFVEGYSKIIEPLTDLLKKGKRWNWKKKCHEAIEDLKRMMVTTPILILPDLEKPFEVHTYSHIFKLERFYWMIGIQWLMKVESCRIESAYIESMKRR